MQYYTIKCFNCRKITSQDRVETNCPSCNGPLDIEYDEDELRQRVNIHVLKSAPMQSYKYVDFFPLNNKNSLISLNEGNTPLYPIKKLFKDFPNIYIKYEGANPTGAFKDRGSFVELNKAKEMHAKAVVVASTGNMAASVSAYASQIGVPCYVFIPEGTPQGKLAQAIAFGAKVIQVRGTYNDAQKLAEETAQKFGFFLCGDYAFRAEGQKSIAYEIVEQLRWQAPDFVVVPVGMGTNLAGIYRGFKEFYQLGIINKIPHFVAVQSDGASPAITSYNSSSQELQKLTKPQTVCSAIAVGNPLDYPKVCTALKESQGYAIEVADELTLKLEKELADKESLFIEPSSATTVSGLSKLIEDGIVKAPDNIVLIATGNGLKDPQTLLKVSIQPPTVEPILEEVERILSTNTFAVRTLGIQDKETILFSTTPDEIKLDEILEEINIEVASESKKELHKQIDSFLKKGKPVTKADLMYILESTLKNSDKYKQILKVLDFALQTTKRNPPQASVEIEFLGHKLEGKNAGVGPVDAIINTLTQLVNGKGDFQWKLIDYKVEINNAGTNAVVEVTMVLEDQDKNKVVEVASSPDIIVASVEAFEKGYNALYWKNHS
jgi:threonine synthase